MIQEWLENIDFAYPRLLSFFLLMPFLIWWYIVKSGKKSGSIKVSTIHSFRGSTFKTKLRHLPFVLRLLALGCLIIALARPQKRNDEQLTGGEGIDIVVCMDVSGSMLSRDFQPNRLAVAREMAAEFIRNRPIDRISLVIFAGESYTMSPLTTDKNTLLRQVTTLQSGLLEDGTLIGEGLATAVERLSESKAKSKVIILLTDGKEEMTEDRIIDPLTALEIAKTRGIKVYTIGMAQEGYTPVQEKTKSVSKTKETIDELLLKRIASETGGEYFRARDKKGLKEIYERIDKLEKVKIEQSAFKRTEEKFLLFVLLALGLLFIEILLKFTILKKFP